MAMVEVVLVAPSITVTKSLPSPATYILLVMELTASELGWEPAETVATKDCPCAPVVASSKRHSAMQLFQKRVKNTVEAAAAEALWLGGRITVINNAVLRIWELLEFR
jgi:hypothetical protein